MTADDFIDRHPVLYHRTPAVNAPGIALHGLLSVAALLKLYRVGAKRSASIERDRAKVGIVVPPPRTHPEWPPILIGDQHQIHPPQMAAALVGTTPEEWRAELNARVFFWPTRQRLAVHQKAYAAMPSVLYEIDAAKLLARHGDRVRVARINTGYFRRRPAMRGRDTYRQLEDFKHDAKTRIAEVSVLGGVSDLADCLLVSPTLDEA